jgi:MFS family permease
MRNWRTIPSLAVFRHPSFRNFQVARLLTIVASEMQSVAVGWQIYAITHRPLDLGLAGLAQFLPSLLLFLVTGATADRRPRQKIVFACLLGFSLCSAALLTLELRGVGGVAAIYCVLVVLGVVRAFHAPTAQALMPQLVPAEEFPRAVAWNSSLFQTATIAGPALGGLIYALTGGARAVYASSAAACLVAAALMTFVHPAVAQRPRGAATLDGILDGFHFVWRNKLVLGAISLDLFAVLLGGAVALLPVYAREILHAGPIGLGLLRSAPGVGAVMTALFVAHRPLRRRVGRLMMAAVASFGVFTIVFGLSHNLWLSMAALFLTGASDAVSVIVRGTMVQISTPDAMRGRVSAVNMLFIGTSNEFGQFESGITAQWLGTVPAVVLGGVGTLLVIALWTRLFPRLGRVDSFADLSVPKIV